MKRELVNWKVDRKKVNPGAGVYFCGALESVMRTMRHGEAETQDCEDKMWFTCLTYQTVCLERKGDRRYNWGEI